jgi:small-conductance mechanosensitive channel
MPVIGARPFEKPIMLLLGLIAFYIAKSAFAEAIHDTNGNTLFGRDIAWWGHRARYVVFFVVALNCVVIMVDMAISDYFTSSSLWWWLIKSTALVLFAYWITKTIVPNPKVVTSRFTQTTNDLPRLNR